MKKYSRIFLSCLLLIFALYFVGCGSVATYKVSFIDYDGTVLSEQTVKEGKAAIAPEIPTHDGFEFLKWDTDFSNVTKDLTIKAKYKVNTLDTRYTDALKIDFDYKNKEFTRDGVGVVKLNKVVDGDTINVYTNASNLPITIRFLGIDTPESTGTIEPWGKAASKYAKETLYNAESILLEREGQQMDSGGKRYLAWVWYRTSKDADYRLFNLEEVELGYTKYSQKVDSKYHNEFKLANDKASMSGKRVWGEIDPNFNYSNEVKETTLLNLWHNHDKYQSGTYFYVTVRLVRTAGNNMYLEDAEEESLEMEDGTIITGKGHFYAFWGFAAPFYRYYKIGDVFRMRCQLEWDSDFGSQLTGLSKYSSAHKDKNQEPVIPVIDANELRYTNKEVKDEQGNIITAPVSDLSNYFCQVVKVDNLICRSVKIKNAGDKDKEYYTAVMENKFGDKFDVYFSNHLISKWDAQKVLEVGKTYSITGGVGYHVYSHGYYQITVGDAPRYNNGVMNPEDALRANDIIELTK